MNKANILASLKTVTLFFVFSIFFGMLMNGFQLPIAILVRQIFGEIIKSEQGMFNTMTFVYGFIGIFFAFLTAYLSLLIVHRRAVKKNIPLYSANKTLYLSLFGIFILEALLNLPRIDLNFSLESLFKIVLSMATIYLGLKLGTKIKSNNNPQNN